LGKISANDISAFNDDSMIEANQATPMNLFGKNGPNMFDDIDGEFAGDVDAAGGPKTRFKEEEDKVDLLKGIRDQKKIIIPKIVKGKEKKAEG
jgi:hypothetical protein